MSATQRTSNALRILLVDHDPVACRLVGLMLERLGCKAVDTAANGRDALDRVLARPYDLLMIDLDLPDLDGRDATRIFVQRLAAQGPRIIAMSAAEDAREVCVEVGADDYLSKPVARQMLAAVLTRAQQQPERLDDFNAAVWAELARVISPAGIVELSTAVIADLPAQQGSGMAALQAGDLAALGRIVHGLRGACLQLGAAALAQLCGQAEAACLGNDRELALRLGANTLARYAALVERISQEMQPGRS